MTEQMTDTQTAHQVHQVRSELAGKENAVENYRAMAQREAERCRAECGEPPNEAGNDREEHMSTPAETASVEEAGRALNGQRSLIGETGKCLGELRRERERVVIEGGNTRELRGKLAETEADLEEQRIQEAELVRRLDRARGAALHMQALQAVRTIYARDLAYLEAERKLRVAQAALARAQAEIDGLGDGLPYYQARSVGIQLERLGVSNDPAAPVRLEHFEDERRTGEPRTPERVAADIARMKGLISKTDDLIHTQSGDSGESI
jgi:hypothetical protein